MQLSKTPYRAMNLNIISMHGSSRSPITWWQLCTERYPKQVTYTCCSGSKQRQDYKIICVRWDDTYSLLHVCLQVIDFLLEFVVSQNLIVQLNFQLQNLAEKEKKHIWVLVVLFWKSKMIQTRGNAGYSVVFHLLQFHHLGDSLCHGFELFFCKRDHPLGPLYFGTDAFLDHLQLV